jgi:hypothetical protein
LYHWDESALDFVHALVRDVHQGYEGNVHQHVQASIFVVILTKEGYPMDCHILSRT